MLEFENKLLENIGEFRRLESEAPAPGYSKDELELYLRRRTAENTDIMSYNNKCIDEHINPMLEAPGNISDSEADALFALTQKLYTVSKNLDMGLSLIIHGALIKRARAGRDTDRLIRSLYCSGIIYHQMRVNGFKRENCGFIQKMRELFSEGASYKASYREIENKDTRMYINRCVGNVYLSIGTTRKFNTKKTSALFFEKVDEAISFWSDAGIRAKDPDFPWDAFINNAHQNVCAWADVLRRQAATAGEHDAYIARRVYDSARALMENDELEGAKRYWSKKRTEYLRYSTSYFVGEIGLDGLLQGLRDIFDGTRDDDYSMEGMFSMTSLSAALLTHLYERSKTRVYDPEQGQEAARIIDRILKYCRNMPASVSKGVVYSHLAEFVKDIFGLFDLESMLELVLSFTSFSHLSTYVHAVQVKNITDAIAEYLIDSRPELFAGICGAGSAAEAAAKRHEILRLASQAALFHDIGKVSYMDMVTLNSRRLYDHEFTLIKEHTQAHEFISIFGERERCISDVIQGHHKWYDNSRGYPEDFDAGGSRYKLIIDIVAVADSIDAATDTIGRSYAAGISLERVIEEIREQAGTRYSPVIAEALKDGALADRIRYCVSDGRKGAYYEAYIDISGQ